MQPVPLSGFGCAPVCIGPQVPGCQPARYTVVSRRLWSATRPPDGPRGSGRAERHYDSLTMREREVMQHVVKGLLNKQIAAELGTSKTFTDSVSSETVGIVGRLHPIARQEQGKTCLRRF
jgi:Bacterial regulatory proteins, luxR family